MLGMVLLSMLLAQDVRTSEPMAYYAEGMRDELLQRMEGCDAPRQLKSLIRRMVQTSPGDRYPSMGDVLTDLASCRFALTVRQAVDGVRADGEEQAALLRSAVVRGCQEESGQNDELAVAAPDPQQLTKSWKAAWLVGSIGLILCAVLVVQQFPSSDSSPLRPRGRSSLSQRIIEPSQVRDDFTRRRREVAVRKPTGEELVQDMAILSRQLLLDAVQSEAPVPFDKLEALWTARRESPDRLADEVRTLYVDLDAVRDLSCQAGAPPSP